MRRRPFWIQLLLVTFALFQTALAPAISVLDARAADSSALRSANHVESERAHDCPPVHADGCALCRFLSHHVGLLGNASPHMAISAARERNPFATERLPALERRLLPPSRAPPVVS